MNELKIIEQNNQRVLTTQQLAEAFGTDSERITKNFNRNKERYKEGKHFDCLEGDVLKEFRTKGQIDLSLNINRLYLWTEKGAWLHAKSLNTDCAWEAYEKLVDDYYSMGEQLTSLSGLSPQLQLLIGIEIEQKAQSKRIDQIEQKQESIKEIIGLNVVGARDKVTSILNKIATALGGGSSFRDIRVESYRLLESRAQCNLSIRQTNKRKKMALEGVTKTAINKITKLDVILDDSRLSEIYFAVVKEMAIHHGIDELESA